MCKQGEFQLQVLGSGGPIADDDRASTSYLLWMSGESRGLIDSGGGSFVRFAKAGANYGELDWIGLSHFHTDHTADLMPLLKSGYFSGRSRGLLVSGPSGNDRFPSLDEFIDANLNPRRGAYKYLSGYLNGSDGLHKLDLLTIDAKGAGVYKVIDKKDLQISAYGVPHGIVPAIAYKVVYKGQVVVFASDQNGNKEGFINFAKGADLLVMHMPVPEGIRGVGRKLHAPPSRIGEIANAAKVKQLLLSHFMARSLRDINDNLAAVRKQYAGPIYAANDLSCYSVTP